MKHDVCTCMCLGDKYIIPGLQEHMSHTSGGSNAPGETWYLLHVRVSVSEEDC